MNVLRRGVALAPRSLALMRVALALVTLYDLADRAVDLRAHYTDSGVLNRAAALRLFGAGGAYVAVGSPVGVSVLVLVHAGAAVALALGWHTTLSTVAVALLHGSLRDRNPLVCHGGDQLLSCVLAFAVLLPLGRRASLDALRAGAPRRRVRSAAEARARLAAEGASAADNDDDQMGAVSSLATCAFLVQISLVYHVAFWHKTSVAWYPHGFATELALALDYFRTPIGALVRAAVPIAQLRQLTLAVLVIEGWAPVLYFVPWWPARLLGCALIIALHVGFGMSLRLGQFAPVGVAAQLGLLPERVWRRWWRRSPAPAPAGEPLLVTFDARCDYCAAAADAYAWWRGARAFSVCACAVVGADVATGARRHVSCLRGPWHGRHRVDHERTPPPLPPPPPSLLDDAVAVNATVARAFAAVALLALSIAVNLHSLGRYVLPEPAAHVANALHLDQHWAMFAPHPPTDQFWYSIEAETHGGERFELFQRRGLKRWRGTPDVNASAPPPGDDLFRSIGSHRWFKYFENGINTSPHNTALRLEFGRWICREYNARRRAPADELFTFELRIYLARIPIDGHPPLVHSTVQSPQTLSVHKCEDERKLVQRETEQIVAAARRSEEL